MRRLHLPRSSYDVSVCYFHYEILDIVGDCVCVYNLYGHARFRALAFVDILSQNRTEIVEKPYRNRRVSTHFKWKSYGARVMSVRSIYEF